MHTRRRSALIWIASVVLSVVLGIGSRRLHHILPKFVTAYAGDTLWAFAAFLGFGLLLPRASTWHVAALAATFSMLIEVSQLYHAPWIDAIRATTPGGLILGFSFVWTDLACYAAGVVLGVVFEWVMFETWSLRPPTDRKDELSPPP
jgi:Protein of unknown function (DUF2809)